MPRQGPKAVPKDRGREYARSARSVLNAALLLLDTSPDGAIVLLINASIKASDAICIAARGEYWQGADHAGAVKFLEGVDKNMAKHLQRVLVDKSRWEYGVELPSKSTLTAITRAAIALVESAESK